jgi:hypothetical protein
MEVLVGPIRMCLQSRKTYSGNVKSYAFLNVGANVSLLDIKSLFIVDTV